MKSAPSSHDVDRPQGSCFRVRVREVLLRAAVDLTDVVRGELEARQAPLAKTTPRPPEVAGPSNVHDLAPVLADTPSAPRVISETDMARARKALRRHGMPV